MVQETTLYEGQHGGSEFSDGIISTRYAFFTRKEFLVYISFWGGVFSSSGRHTLAGSLNGFHDRKHRWTLFVRR